MKELVARGYVQRRRGYKRAGERGTGRGSRFWPRNILLQLAARHGINRETVRDDFRSVPRNNGRRRRKVSNPVSLKALKVHQNSNPPRLAIDCSDPVAAARIMEVVAHNALAASTAVEGCAAPAWRREFKGDLAADLYGRWHAVGDGNYQSMPEADRLTLRIGDEPVAEIDIKGSFITLMHGVVGIPATNTDPYLIPGFDRADVKQWVTATIGKGTPARTWPRGKQRNGIGSPARPSAIVVGDAVMRRYPFFREPWRLAEHLAAYGDPKRLLFHYLCGLEARIISAVMQALRERGILALPMHDGLIVPASAADAAMSILQDVGWQVASVRLSLTVDSVKEGRRPMQSVNLKEAA